MLVGQKSLMNEVYPAKLIVTGKLVGTGVLDCPSKVYHIFHHDSESLIFGLSRTPVPTRNNEAGNTFRKIACNFA